jgi:hypothetical protein
MLSRATPQSCLPHDAHPSLASQPTTLRTKGLAAAAE